MKATIFGAGAIGRGLVGAVLADTGYELTFVDANSELVRLLDGHGSFSVVAGEHRAEYPIDAVLDAADPDSVTHAVAESDLVATAVGPPVLAVVAQAIAVGLANHQGGFVNVLACENVHPNSAALEGHVSATGLNTAATVGYPDVVVDRIVPEAPLSVDVVVEPDFEFVVDAARWSGPRPEGTSMIFTDELDAYKRRKLWLVNGLHAATAWLGLDRGHRYVHEAIADDAIRPTIESVAGLSVHALAATTDEFDRSDLEAYARRVLMRFEDTRLPDVNRRVARNPLLKLSAGERVFGPAEAVERMGGDATAFADVVVAGLRLRDSSIAGVDDLTRHVTELGMDGMLAASGLREDSPLRAAITAAMSGPGDTERRTMLSETIVIENPAGLHARPAAQVVEQAQLFSANVTLKKGEKQASASSIMSVLALGAGPGDTITLEAEGDDAEAAMAALKDIMLGEED